MTVTVPNESFEPSREIDPLAGAVARFIDHRGMLTKMAGEMLTTSQVEVLLGIKRKAVGRRRNAYKLLALRMRSGWHYPAFQFHGGKTLPGLEGVLKAHEDDDPWVILDVLLAPDQSMEGRTLLQAIQEQDDRVIARHIAQIKGDGFA